MKSHVNDLTEVAVCIIKDATALNVAQQPVRDLKTLRSRVKHEGLSFLTITLPTFGKDFERSLDLGRIDSSCFRSFRKHKGIPAFLQGILSRVFDLGTGGLLDEPDVTAIRSIRQIAYAFKKLEVDCKPIRVSKTLSKFTDCERIFEEPLAPADVADFTAVSQVLWGSIFTPHTLEVFDAVPKHGPGATAERISGNGKYRHRRWHERLEPYFPLLANAFSSESAYAGGEFEGVSLVSEEREQPVRVIPVPKTLKGPRIIAIEPVCMQYTQQALATSIRRLIELHPLTSGHVNFRDQEINRCLAMSSSADQELATLDLSAASDRVPRSLALSMFDSHPDLRDAIDACRSRTAQMPSGDIIPLKKFAAMGSALCFPVEAMYFYTICIVSRLKKRGLPVTWHNVMKMTRQVYVYGDDILVPTDDATTVAEDLTKYYCKVNMSKSYWNGKFRESCGMDAYDGKEVTPTYLRQVPPCNRRDPASLVSWVKASNHFYLKGYWRTADHLVKRCETILGKLPLVGPECAGLGKVSYQPAVSIGRWGKRYQVAEVETWVAKPVYRIDKLTGYSALTKSLLNLATPLSPGEVRDKKHLVRSALHGAVVLRRRWIRPY